MGDWSAYLPTATKDFLEVGILAVVIYLILRLVRGTIAGTILRGAAVMVLLAFVVTAVVVKALDMQVIQALLTGVVSALVTGLLIVFQPELRRGLFSLGEQSMFVRLRTAKKGCEVELGKAVKSLVRERHGALFALERNNQLNHIAKTGQRLDARAGAELMASIFWPGNPLHDGGMILRGSKIVAAACIFPVSEQRDLSTRFGTRHRAAIGLSEESDAVVVVVSEETGRVSVALGGKLQVIEPPSNLVPFLQKLMETSDTVAEAETSEASDQLSESFAHISQEVVVSETEKARVAREIEEARARDEAGA